LPIPAILPANLRISRLKTTIIRQFVHSNSSPEQEDELSKQHKITIRCIPLDSASLPQQLSGGSNDMCFLTGKPAATRALCGRSC
jgi:hypothetical protein